MYIYEPELSSSHSQRKEQPITSRLAQHNAYCFDQSVGRGLGGKENSSRYVWANGGLGQVPAVFSLPKDIVKIPGDPVLLEELNQIKTNEARALRQAFLSFGKPKQFVETLITALRAMPLPDEDLKKYEIYLARLGVEAFILGISVTGDKKIHIGFVDHPSRLLESFTSSHREFFLHFAIKRLLKASSSASASEAHRIVLDRSTRLFAAIQSDLAREYRLINVSETLLLSYRQLLVAVIWKHYQLQMDDLLKKTNSSKLRFPDALKELEALFKKASITLVHDKHSMLPNFQTKAKVYRDYFIPSSRSDIGFSFFSSATRLEPGNATSISFRSIARQRAKQKQLLDELQRLSSPHLPPKLHSSASWQGWLRNMWDEKLRMLFTHERMDKVLGVVEQYFEAFTAHVPYDLREGCAEKSYLTRLFPRSITGAVVHDCAVYAVRWIHILGQIISPSSPTSGISNPRIFLVEMPSHVGVMIRIKHQTSNDLVISINNKHAKIHSCDRSESDVYAAQTVVQDHYQWMKTPFIATRITASPSNATSLWKQVCRIYDKKLRLPYVDKSEPHLRYLAYNTGVAHITRQIADTVAGLWVEFQKKLATAKQQTSTVPPDRVQAELRLYCRSVEKAIKAASVQYKKDVHPLIDEINQDLRVNQHRLPKGAVVTEPELFEPLLFLRLPWESAWGRYRPELEKAVKSGEISRINPESFFPEDDFVAAVQ